MYNQFQQQLTTCSVKLYSLLTQKLSNQLACQVQLNVRHLRNYVIFLIKINFFLNQHQHLMRLCKFTFCFVFFFFSSFRHTVPDWRSDNDSSLSFIKTINLHSLTVVRKPTIN